MNKLLFPLIILFLYLAFVMPTNAQTMSNDNYVIQMGNLNSIAGQPSSPNYKMLFTVGQTGPGFYSGTNYRAKAGFEYIKSIIPFRFTISNILIDFGPISPTVPVLRTNQLTISNGSAFGYQVTASQNHNLQTDPASFNIPATTCDSGNCTPPTAAVWNNSLTYGFGYNCQNIVGTDCDPQFSDITYYKPFISSPSAIVVMSGHNAGKGKTTQITYKLNISGSQVAGLYTNVINYIAMPTF